MSGPSLLPLQAGEQYRFTFAVEACVGCHSCEVACAEQNGTPVEGAWRRVGELEGGTYPHTRRFSLSIACNHCVEPTCLSGCPTNAYEKLANGIVVHHEAECVGCQYCMWNCPYEVPVFSPVRKVVSKCDMCRPRIDAGQAPACVGACPTQAIGVEPVDVARWRADHHEADAPGLPPASITLSTTRVVLPAGLPEDMAAANERPPSPEHPHWPLVVLTLLTQLSLGMVTATWLLELGGGERGRLGGAAVAALAAGVIALGASLFHLGRPARALKAVRNLRTSWLSREVALFGLFSALCGAYSASWLLPGVPGTALGGAAVVAGAAGVWASARLYLVPARPVWDSPRTPAAFFATAGAVGPVATLLCVDRAALAAGPVRALVVVAMAATACQVVNGLLLRRSVRRSASRQYAGTGWLLAGPLRHLVLWRAVAAGVTLALLASALAVPFAGPAAGGRMAGALVVAAAGELVGRYLFYVSVVPYRVAGGFFGPR